MKNSITQTTLTSLPAQLPPFFLNPQSPPPLKPSS